MFVRSSCLSSFSTSMHVLLSVGRIEPPKSVLNGVCLLKV